MEEWMGLYFEKARGVGCNHAFVFSREATSLCLFHLQTLPEQEPKIK